MTSTLIKIEQLLAQAKVTESLAHQFMKAVTLLPAAQLNTLAELLTHQTNLIPVAVRLFAAKQQAITTGNKQMLLDIFQQQIDHLNFLSGDQANAVN